MNKKIFYTILIATLLFTACSKQEKKPFGAENIDYDKVEGINKDGPVLNASHDENTPPISDKVTIVENGPTQIDYPDIVIEPTADMDEEPDFGGLPIVENTHKE